MGLVKDVVRLVMHRDPVGLCVGLARQNGGMTRLRVPGRRNFWVVSDPGLYDQVLRRDAAAYDKSGPIYDVIREAGGTEGLFTGNDPRTWKSLRTTMNPAFARTNMAPVADLAVRAWHRHISGWNGGTPVRLFDEFKRFNVELLVKHLFGQQAGDDCETIVDLAQHVFDGMARRIFLPAWFPGTKAYQRAIAELEQRVYAIIRERRRLGVDHDDVLGHLMTAEPGFTDKQIRDQAFTLIMAGFDSTATAQAWACAELAADADRFHALQAEVDGVVGDRLPTLADVKQLTQLSEFFVRIVQQHPSFPLFFRNVTTASRLGGHAVDEGDQLILVPAEAGLPFGTGKRKCIGEDMALVTGILTLAMLLQRFERLDRLRSRGRDRIAYAMTAPPRDGARVCVQVRRTTERYVWRRHTGRGAPPITEVRKLDQRR